MSNETTRRMISAYFQDASPTAFFSGMFQARPENMHSSEEVEIDIERTEEDVSVVIQDLSNGYRMNSDDIYTNKSFVPPIHKEAIPINAFDLIQRMPGEDPFISPDFRANVMTRMFKGMRKIERKIRRAIELQASQVLQTGTVTLPDFSGNALYTIDYAPKPTHFPTAGTSWATASTAQKIADLQSLANVVRADGLMDPDMLVFGQDAWENLIQDQGVLLRLDNRRADLGRIVPMELMGGGGQYRGRIDLGNYQFDVYTYNGRYTDPATNVSTQYMTPGNVIVKCSMGRMDATFGAIPNIGNILGSSGRLLPELPGRMSSSERGMDMFTNVWMTEDGEQLFGGVGARPLMIPTAIDTYGCLTTGL